MVNTSGLAQEGQQRRVPADPALNVGSTGPSRPVCTPATTKDTAPAASAANAAPPTEAPAQVPAPLKEPRASTRAVDLGEQKNSDLPTEADGSSSIMRSTNSSNSCNNSNDSADALEDPAASSTPKTDGTHTRKNSATNNMNITEDTKESGGYGIPCGDESMRSLRRHVELLIDREVNTKTRSRLETCLDALEPEQLDPQLLRVVCAKGLPEGCPALRSLYWRILLHCLPLRASEWRQHRRKLRDAYESYKAEFIREPEAVRRLRRMQQQHKQQRGEASAAPPKGRSVGGDSNDAGSPPSSHEASVATGSSGRSPQASSISLAAVSDHPLCRSATSEWRGFWVDAEVFDQINKDVFRTRPELCFFALNPQQTVRRQQQLHLYPPPPTRQPQHPYQQTDEIPLLVDYDVLVRQKQQRREASGAQDEATHVNSKTRMNKGSSRGSGKTSTSSANNDTDGSSKASMSSLKGFRLPAAFRSKKAASSPAPPARNLSEDACGSNSKSSRGASGYSSRPFPRAADGGGAGTQRQQHETGESGAGDRKAGSSFVGSSFSYWVDEMQRRGGSSCSRQSADAADALEASAAAAKAARQYKRQMNRANSHGENPPSHSSAPDLRLHSRDSGESGTTHTRGETASMSFSYLGREEDEGEKLPQDACDTLPPVTAAGAAAASEVPKGKRSPLPSRRAVLGGLADSSLPSGGEGEVAKVASKEEKANEVQPWRAPAGVQDVCNMLNPRRHYDVLARLLFIYAKVNPGLCYVQGMNEILAPIYYALMTDPTYTDYEQAEAEIFYCFSEVMQQQRDAFCKALDPTDAGVRGRLSRLDALLRHKDEEIWMHLTAVGVEPQFYALRWLLLMLTQEFEMPDVLALWDGFIADSGRPLPLLYYVCVGMIIWLKPALLAGDFTACMKLLQHLPSFDPKALISSAMRLRADDLLGNRPLAWRASMPVAVGEGRLGEGLRELDPLQLSDYQPFKPFPHAGSSGGNSGLSGLTANRSPADMGSPESAVAREWRGEPITANAQRNNAGLSRDNSEGSDAALGHLKRLAGAGVEQAYKGASVVSQYLNNSGLALGLASNITSFFTSEPQPRSSARPHLETHECVPTGRPRRPAAAKNEVGNFVPPPATLASSAPGGLGYHAQADTDTALPEPDGAGERAHLEECPFTATEFHGDAEAESLPITESASVGESLRHGSLWEDEGASPLGQRPPTLEEMGDTPRNAETRPFTTSGQGVRITIL